MDFLYQNSLYKVYELSTVSRCVGKTKALLAAKRSLVRNGSQMCLSVQ